MTDRLDDMFAVLRADTIARVRPPGADAARRTLRQRRTVRTIGATACLAVAGAFAVPLAWAPAPDADPGAVLDRQRRAAAVLPGAPDYRHQRGAQDVVGGDGEVATKLMVGGRYTLRLACVGSGRVTLSLETGPGQRVGGATARCTTAGAVVAAPFEVAVTMQIVIRLAGSRARGAGYAYSVELSERDRQRLVATAGAMLPAVQGRVANQWDGLAAVGAAGRHGVDPGRYRLSAACSGAGHIQVRIQAPDRDETLAMACGPPALGATVTFRVAEAGQVRFTLDPESDADRQAGYRIRVERLG